MFGRKKKRRECAAQRTAETGNPFVPVHTAHRLQVNFEAHDSPFLLLQAACGHADCDSRTVMLTFLETDDAGDPKEDPLHFDLLLNLDTWQEEQRAPRPPHVARLTEELMSTPSAEMNSRLSADLEDHRESMRRAARFTLPRERVRAKAMVTSGEVFGGVENTAPVGLRWAFPLEYEGSRYWAIDSYCIDPHCECNEAHISFLGAPGSQEEGETRALENLVSILLTFEYSFRIYQTHSWSKEAGEALIRSWLSRYPEAIEVMEWRYGRIKEIGQRILHETTAYTESPRYTQRRRGRGT
jgi:hypothetical protein